MSGLNFTQDTTLLSKCVSNHQRTVSDLNINIFYKLDFDNDLFFTSEYPQKHTKKVRLGLYYLYAMECLPQVCLGSYYLYAMVCLPVCTDSHKTKLWSREWLTRDLGRTQQLRNGKKGKKVFMDAAIHPIPHLFT